MSESVKTNPNVYAKLNTCKGKDERAENDFYSTPPEAVELLLKQLELSPNIWEPACGMGHISKTLEAAGYNVRSTDLIDRGYGTGGIDFLQCEEIYDGDLVTNPAYSIALEFAEKALELVPEGHRVCMFLKIQFLESKSRRDFLKANPPKHIFTFSKRMACHKDGIDDNKPSAAMYCWLVWEKGYKGDSMHRIID